jgi:putative transposase
MDYRYGSHTVFQMKYHFVWVTKYRNKVLRGEERERLRERVQETCEAFENRIVKGAVSQEHVHILVSCPPNRAPSEIMRRIKGRTSSKRLEEFPHLKKKYWRRHFWARGYFCAAVGQMTKEMIEQYLAHHFEPRLDDEFTMDPG